MNFKLLFYSLVGGFVLAFVLTMFFGLVFDIHIDDILKAALIVMGSFLSYFILRKRL